MSKRRRVNEEPVIQKKMTAVKLYKQPMAPLRTGGFQPRYNGRSKQEVKYIDVGYNESAVQLPSAAPKLLNPIQQTIDINGRVGREVLLKKATFRCMVKPTGTQIEWARVLIVYDKQSNSAAPQITDVIRQLVDISGTVIAPSLDSASLAFQNLDNKDRFKILADFKLSSVTGDIGNMYEERHVNLKGLNTTFSTSGTTAGSITSGGIFAFFIAMSNPSATISENAECYLASRIRYID